jgi:hypothetical protein
VFDPCFFSNPGSRVDEDQLPNINRSASFLGEMQNEAHVEIALGFQVFITWNDPQKLSSALCSRCFCVNIESANGEEDLTVLARRILFQKV